MGGHRPSTKLGSVLQSDTGLKCLGSVYTIPVVALMSEAQVCMMLPQSQDMKCKAGTEWQCTALRGGDSLPGAAQQ